MKNNVSADDLAVLLAVIREGGFRAASKRLGVAASKVSTTVSRIETQLGTPVLRRTTRSQHLTEAGQLLVDRVGPLLSAVDAACHDVATLGGQIQGRLTLNVPGAVMPDILPPLLAAYRTQHPNVEVEIKIESDLVDIVAAGCDAGIRYGSVLEQDMISIPIGPRRQQMALAASPAYLEAHGRPHVPEDLTAHHAIRYRLDAGPLLPWMLQSKEQSVSVEPKSALILSVGALNTGLRYAQEGMGIVYTFRHWLDDDFESGKLMPVLYGWWPHIEGPHLYYPSRFAPKPLRAFIEICQSTPAEG
ncbi:LysR family transcriptional regulator [Celeribacter halophilus]|uniref:DNA-binding transcriptional regulator, LysR family n=1 Tax=Celeribacter halophilus TaxID=576117 RepID=A0A1I3U1R5_9RHOB|nr:LysR family transcriptional regulator [Celeribacter halophilus]PZX10179.1 DNA-binding transcriptional LysR family regulator [Celeribacter halophilus]SFJ77508.1 DNA-binding transcriptional regulator, LysR family [Celeribacter halophilus]